MPVAVKTCGLSDRAAVDAALAGGARFLGFVFFPPSPRDVAPRPGRDPERGHAGRHRDRRRHGRAGRRLSRRYSLRDATRLYPTPRKREPGAGRGRSRAHRLPHHQGDQRVPSLRHCPRRRLRRKRRPDSVRRQGNGRRHAARRQCADLRLGAVRGRAAAVDRVAAVGRIGCRERGRGDQDHGRPRGRCFVRHRIRARGRKDPEKISAFLAAAAAATATLPNEAQA